MNGTLNTEPPLSIDELTLCRDGIQSIADDQEWPSDIRESCAVIARAIDTEIARLKERQA